MTSRDMFTRDWRRADTPSENIAGAKRLEFSLQSPRTFLFSMLVHNAIVDSWNIAVSINRNREASGFVWQSRNANEDFDFSSIIPD